jgi:predicted nucleic acid-binding Zn ribbon protein
MSDRGRKIRRPDHGPQPVANSMAKVLGRLGAPQSLDTMEVIFTRWLEVVGPELAGHVQPVRVHGNVLVISADHPTWVTRCRMEAERIITTARTMGDTTVERVEVVLQRPQ